MSIHERQIINILRRKGRLFLDHEGWTYDLSPPDFIKMSLPPNTKGIDSFLEEGARAKGIDGDFNIVFSREWFFECDASAFYSDKFMEGCIYEVKFREDSRKAWVCSYLGLLFSEPPQVMHISIG
jgi:hypothetical protein